MSTSTIVPIQYCLFLSTEECDIESALIRRFTLCDYSHVGFFRLTDNYTYSAMCDGKGVAWRPPNSKAKILLLDCPRVSEALEVALTKQGEAYDVAEIIGFITNKNVETPNKFICDRLVFWAFQQIGQPLLNHTFIPIEHLTPRDILLSPLVTEKKL